MLERCGDDGATGAAEAAADLLSGFVWTDQTWSNRASQIKKWFAFCEEDGRPKFGASEGDVLAYIGYLHLEGRVGPTSVAQYVTAVSRYHDHHNYPSPTHTPLVSALVKAYASKADLQGLTKTARVGLPAGLVLRIVSYGLQTDVIEEVCYCTMVLFAFVFQCRSVSVAHLQDSDVTVTDAGVTAVLTHRKAKSRQRPLRLSYPRCAAWTMLDSPLELFKKWHSLRPPHLGFFNIRHSRRLGTADLGVAVEHAVAFVGASAPEGCFYASHSARIGGYNELLGLQFTREWIMTRLDWTSPNMIQVYFDSRISVTAASEFFFAHMRPTA